MRGFRTVLICFILGIIVLGGQGCKKPLTLSQGHLEFSVDTLLFDTVFTSIGSTTLHFKIYNRENKLLKIDEVQLMGGGLSPFRINLDGLSGTQFQDIEIPGGDSLFVFAEVTLDPNGSNLPLIIEDSVRFRSNGLDQYVKLAAWGQDAYFHHLDENDGVWLADKPHVVYDASFVLEDKTLTIEAGAKVHFHKNSLLFVKRGRLIVNGEKGKEVEFLGDRLESFYDDVAGQWYGIYLDSCLPSQIDHALIKNGTAGIHVTGNNPANAPGEFSLTLTNSRLFNHASYGVFSYAGAKINMENTLIAKNGRHAFFSLAGGSFSIRHCDLLSYANSNEEQIAFAVKNYFNTDGITLAGDVDGKIYNSVIYGYQEHEFVLDTIGLEQGISLNFEVKNCVLKNESISSGSIFEQISWNADPLFTDITAYDFHFLTSSPLSNKGNSLYSTPLDLEGNTRSVNTPDIGVYEID
ncbi:MAG: right-handed parallel beta-helix repeat-containing protein [Bacteroidetes bacterium]|nr:MAG: right-handed parallel beta-helix repeat-containing protein [Bacteroidota bacterium]